MFGSNVLEIGIGLIFVYLIISLVCMAANEALASLFSWRAHNLRAGIRNLLDGPDPASTEWAQKFYNHPLIQGLSRKGHNPSYIPSRTFALALTDLVLPPEPGARVSTARELREAIHASPCPPALKQVLRLLVDEAERSSMAGEKLRLHGVLDPPKLESLFEQVQQHIEIWFNNAMERVSGWYKRRLHAWTIGIAVTLTVALNVDSVQIARQFARDSALRSLIVAQAEQMAQQPPTMVVVNAAQPPPVSPGAAGSAGAPPAPGAVDATGARAQMVQRQIEAVKTIGIPMGWPDPEGAPTGPSWFLLKVMGLLLTAGAASLGAPFWFDVLNKFMTIRSAGRAPEEAPKPPKQIPIPSPPGRPEGAPPSMDVTTTP